MSNYLPNQDQKPSNPCTLVYTHTLVYNILVDKSKEIPFITPHPKTQYRSIYIEFFFDSFTKGLIEMVKVKSLHSLKVNER